jgi:hypothetical protein
MIYRAAVLSAILLASTISAHAAEQKGWSFKGTCSNGNISESDGVQTGMGSGSVSTKDYFAVMKRARAAHLTLGTDGFLWSTQPLSCDSVTVKQIDDYKGHTAVSFSNGDPRNPLLIFAGSRVGGDGPLFFSDSVYLGKGKDIPINPGTGQGCHFYFDDHGSFTQGWESRLNTIECELRLKTETGHLIQASVTFHASQPPLVPEVSHDPATSKTKELP